LTAATKPEDLADAFAWFRNKLTEQDAHDQLQFIRHRTRLLHGCTSLQGSIPVPTRALNIEVAILMMRNLGLAFDIRLTGLRSAPHLNGWEGVICGPDPADEERWTARLDDRTCVSVKPRISCTCVVGTTGTNHRECISCGGGLAARRQRCDWGTATPTGTLTSFLVPNLIVYRMMITWPFVMGSTLCCWRIRHHDDWSLQSTDLRVTNGGDILARNHDCVQRIHRLDVLF
jgi:hypothetical protein